MEVVCFGGIRVDNDVLRYLNQKWTSLPNGLRADPSAKPYPSFLKTYGNTRPAARVSAPQPPAQGPAHAPGGLSFPVSVGGFSDILSTCGGLLTRKIARHHDVPSFFLGFHSLSSGTCRCLFSHRHRGPQSRPTPIPLDRTATDT